MTHGLFPKAVLPDVWVSFLGATWSLSTEWQFYVLALGAARGRAPPAGLGAAGDGGGRSGMASVGAGVWRFSRAFLPNKAHFFALGVASLPVVRSEAGAVQRYGAVLAASLSLCATQGSLGQMLPPLAWTLCLAVQMRPDEAGLRWAGSAAQPRGSLFRRDFLLRLPGERADP